MVAACNGGEHLEYFGRHGMFDACGRRLPRFQGLEKSLLARAGGVVQPFRITQRCPDHGPMNQGVLPHVEHGQVNAEGIGTAQQTLNRDQPGVFPLVG